MMSTAPCGTEILSIPSISIVETIDWEKTLVKQEPDETSPLSPPPSSDYSPSLRLAEEINEINKVRTMEGTPPPLHPSTEVSATSISAGISTLLAQTSSSTPSPTGAVQQITPPNIKTSKFLRSDSLTDEYELLSPNESMDLPMSPPLSQESQTSFTHGSSQEYPKSLHPFDQGSPPRKTLNWVNALPSHFETTVPNLPRKRRRRTNREELEILEDAFARNLLPDAATRQQLGARLGMSVRAVQIWFQNRRQTLRKKSITSGTHTGSSEDDTSRSDSEDKRRIAPYRNSMSSSESLPIMASPTSSTKSYSGDEHFGASGFTNARLEPSKSCSNLSTSTTGLESTFLRSETCSSLPTYVSSLATPTKALSTQSSLVSPPSSQGDHLSPTMANIKLELPTPSLALTVKEPGNNPTSSTTATPATTTTTAEALSPLEKFPTIVDSKVAEHHLCMLLQEAKRRSAQGAAPVLALWPETGGKAILNSSLSGPLPMTTASIPQPNRTMSAPSVRSSGHGSSHPGRSGYRTSRKSRTLPMEMPSSSYHKGSPYPRMGVSLMEQVINRQQHRIQPSNFKQSALSLAGKHHPSLKQSVQPKAPSAPAPPSPPQPSSTAGFSPSQLAHRLQTVVRANLKRIQSESALGLGLKSLPPASPPTSPPTPLHSGLHKGERTALRARRLPIGKFLFDSDTDECPPVLPSRYHSSLAPQGQKRRARTPITKATTGSRAQCPESDDDETDEDVFFRSTFRREQLKKRLSNPMTQLSTNKIQKQGWHGSLKAHRRATLNQVASLPTREYGVELEQSQGLGLQILERNRSLPTSTFEAKEDTGASNTDATKSPTPENLNLDELECANVLAGLGWGR
ncbi:hypothetical protein BGZ74_009278 [Mortierella antarctica]|nr:hypothetical protein BGZ74_009278 [Mortierella antarctica]